LKILVYIVAGISKFLACFATFEHFSYCMLSETRMSYFCHNGMLLPLFDNLGTVPPRLSIKLTTVATTPRTV